jgi:glycerol-3-phosphate dehydrogenase subunit B
VAQSIVLATGGFASGGIETDSRWVTRERVLGLPLRGVPAEDQERFVGAYLEAQPMARVGVAVDAELRAEGADNVVVVGAALPGAAPWREGSGEGIALSSGFRAAEVLGSAGAAGHGAAARGASEAVA